MSDPGGKESSLKDLSDLPGELERFREMLLANVVMIGEIPSPTFGEEKRIAFVKQRFTECGLQSSSSDGIGNGVGIITGTEGDKTILLSAHADIPFSPSTDHTFTVEPNVLRGPGVADNSLGTAVLLTLPTILEGLGIQLKCDLLLMAAIQSLEQGNQRGIRFFLENTARPITAAIAVEGCPLGRLNYRSMASLGGIISCNVDRKISEVSAIEILNGLIHQLNLITSNRKQDTACVLGAVQGGASYKLPARTAELKFQIRSETDENVVGLQRVIEVIVAEAGKREGVAANLEIIAQTRAGGLTAAHPFVTVTREIMQQIGILPHTIVHSSTISPFLEHSIPAVCIGISEGDNLNYMDEYVYIDPILRGVAQLIGLLLRVDGGAACA